MILSVLSALAEPTRLAAPQILHDGDKHCVCDLMRRLGVTQGRMSRHMRVLKQAGPLIDRRDAQWVRSGSSRIWHRICAVYWTQHGLKA